MENGLFEVIQSIVLKNPEGKILILSKNEKWLLPGGRIQESEDLHDALIREVKEETGISDFSIGRVIDIGMNHDQTKIIITYEGAIGGQNVILSNEHDNFNWVTFDELDQYAFWHEDIKKRILKAI